MPANPQLGCSVVVPVYNEDGNLLQLHQEILETMGPLGMSYEVVYVDDGSTDGSLETLRGLAHRDPHVRVLAFERNAGQSAALDAAFKAARGDVVVMLDADLQNDPRDIPLLLSELEKHDVAIGWRHKRRDGLVKRATSRVGNTVRNWITREVVADTGCSLKAFKREVLAPLKLYRGMHRFLPTLCRMEGFTVAQVRVNHRPRLHGKTKYGVLDRLAATVPDVLAVRWMQSRALHYKVREEFGGGPR
jgi:dolichol-phosphate mannosyltransferase